MKHAFSPGISTKIFCNWENSFQDSLVSIAMICCNIVQIVTVAKVKSNKVPVDPRSKSTIFGSISLESPNETKFCNKGDVGGAGDDQYKINFTP